MWGVPGGYLESDGLYFLLRKVRDEGFDVLHRARGKVNTGTQGARPLPLDLKYLKFRPPIPASMYTVIVADPQVQLTGSLYGH